jgi:hypothetical protein
VDGELQPPWTSSVPATGLLAAGCGNDPGSYGTTALASPKQQANGHQPSSAAA